MLQASHDTAAESQSVVLQTRFKAFYDCNSYLTCMSLSSPVPIDNHSKRVSGSASAMMMTMGLPSDVVFQWKRCLDEER
jgi:hypothetical protein